MGFDAAPICDRLSVNSAPDGPCATFCQDGAHSVPSTSRIYGPAQVVTVGGSAAFLGEGFAANESVSISGRCMASGVSVTANASGQFPAAVPFTQDCHAGSTTITALGAVSKVPATATVTVQAATPTPTATATATPTATVTPTSTATATDLPFPTQGVSTTPANTASAGSATGSLGPPPSLQAVN